MQCLHENKCKSLHTSVKFAAQDIREDIIMIPRIKANLVEIIL